MDEEHDPWNEESHRHPRARALMTEDSLWDCVNELAPFGSDEGADAYCEWRRWRAENPQEDALNCIRWILGGNEAKYNNELLRTDVIAEHLESDDDELLFNYPDIFTLDGTIIATVLGQLVDEGRIDKSVKPYVTIAVKRQAHPLVLDGFHDAAIREERQTILEAIQSVVEKA